MRVPLAGGTQETLLSEVGPVLLHFFSTADACALRLVCREFLAAVTEHPWEDHDTFISSVGTWRACFPRARCANVWPNVVDADFVHLEGLREVDMASCCLVTDAAFVHLRGIHTLDMSDCGRSFITDAAFAHLSGIHTLDCSYCEQLTDAAFAHLRGIHTLSIRNNRIAITDAAFANLRSLRKLDMENCDQLTITDAAFLHLAHLRTLDMRGCSQPTITDQCRESLRARGVELLW